MFHANHPQGNLHRECRTYAEEGLQGLQDRSFVNSHLYRKMIWYMVENLWLALQFHRAIGVPASAEDRRRYALGAPLFALGDFLIDDTDQPLADIRAFIRNPEMRVDFPHHEVFRSYHRLFTASIPDDHDKERFYAYYFQLHEAQMASRGQRNPAASLEALDGWIRDKIGIGFLMIRSMIPQPWLAGEDTAWYELGALTQYCNDVLDLRKDLETGVRNFANARPSWEVMRRDLRSQHQKAVMALKQLPVPPSQIRRLLFDFEAFRLVMEARLAWYQKLCRGAYSAEAMKQFTRKQTELSPAHPFSVRRALPPLLRFRG